MALVSQISKRSMSSMICTRTTCCHLEWRRFTLNCDQSMLSILTECNLASGVSRMSLLLLQTYNMQSDRIDAADVTSKVEV